MKKGEPKQLLAAVIKQWIEAEMQAAAPLCPKANFGFVCFSVLLWKTIPSH